MEASGAPSGVVLTVYRISLQMVYKWRHVDIFINYTHDTHFLFLVPVVRSMYTLSLESIADCTTLVSTS
jgi:hypothetical protein